MAKTLGIAHDVAYTAETAGYFHLHHVVRRVVAHWVTVTRAIVPTHFAHASKWLALTWMHILTLRWRASRRFDNKWPARTKRATLQ